MPDLRVAAKGVVWFEDPTPIYRLMLLQSSAMRRAYQAIHKHGLRGNDVKNHLKQQYMAELNQRYLSDAVSRVSGIKQDGVLFGGKDAWKRLVKKEITATEWQVLRNNQLYSRGDASKDGNPNIRIVGEELWVKDPSSRGGWIKGRLFLPQKFEVDTRCYDARLTRRPDGRFDLVVTWDAHREPKEVLPGAIGVDINPSGIAVSEVDGEGNLVWHTWIPQQRTQFASKNKRKYDVEEMACEIVRIAERCRKPVVIEDLKFREKKGSKKFNRMRSNFLFSQMTTAIERRAIKSGLPVTKVNPAFTSDLGMLKYRDMFSLSDHASAAFVIARRGMGIVERQTFDVTEVEVLPKKGTTRKKKNRANFGTPGRMKNARKKMLSREDSFEDLPKPQSKGILRLNLAGKGRSLELTPKAWEWMRVGFLHPRKHLGSQPQIPYLSETVVLGVFPRGERKERGLSRGEIPRGEPRSTTGRSRDAA